VPKVNLQTPDWLRQVESILEELNEGVVIVDDSFASCSLTRPCSKWALYKREELLGRTPDAIFPPEDIPYIMRQHESGHRYGRSRNEFYLPRENGEKIPVIFSGRVIRASTDRATFW
jgi:PAS domain S-box-containing protein